MIENNTTNICDEMNANTSIYNELYGEIKIKLCVNIYCDNWDYTNNTCVGCVCDNTHIYKGMCEL